jgi:hypothetical protein
MSTRTGDVRTTRRRLHLRLASVDRELDLAPGPLAASLAPIVEALDDAAEHAGWGQPPALVRITPPASIPLTEGFDLGIRTIDDDRSVVETLAGFVAPPDWLAVGVITEGNARHLEHHTAQRTRVRCVHLVERSGGTASTLRLQGGDVTVMEGNEPQGRIDDVCRRALGLPTAPPAHSSAELWAAMWLSDVLATAAACDPAARLRWPAVAELHPALAMIVQHEPQWRGKTAESLGRLGDVLAEVQSWSVVREACAKGEWPVDDVPADVAAWLDDGAFSRWVLGGFPPIDQLARAVSATLPPSVARRVRAVLRGWELIEP